MRTALVDSFSAASPSQTRNRARVASPAPGLIPESPQREAARANPASSQALPLEISFLTAYGVPTVALTYAASIARRQGVSADAVLIAEGIVSEELFYRSLAEYLGVEYFERGAEVAPSAAGLGYARLRNATAGVTWLFAPVGAEIFRLLSVARNSKGRPLFAVTTRTHLIEALRRASPIDVAQMAARSAERVDPDLCVRESLKRKPLAISIGYFALVAFCLVSSFPPAATASALILAVAFLSSVYLRLIACVASFESQDRAAWIEDARLPVYTVVIALYREAAVAAQLARAIDRLDYPALGSKRT